MAAKRQKSRAEELLERALGAISGLAVLCIGGYLLWEGLSETSPPELAVEVAAVDTGRDGGGVLPFTVRNTGGRSATAVAVSLTLSRDGQFVAERRLVIDYVPSQSEVEGAFVLPEGAEGLQQAVAVEGYVAP
jgi:uncharacterized protein (TIGR02588 family)